MKGATVLVPIVETVVPHERGALLWTNLNLKLRELRTTANLAVRHAIQVDQKGMCAPAVAGLIINVANREEVMMLSVVLALIVSHHLQWLKKILAHSRKACDSRPDALHDCIIADVGPV